MMNNIDLFELSLKNPEPFIDEYYVKINDPIIPQDQGVKNKLIISNSEIINNISAYKIATESKNLEMKNEVINNLIRLLDVDGINFSEFVSFWSVMDVSYSIYKKFSNEEKMGFLNIILLKYISLRHNLYIQHGYTPTTLQVGKDAKSHKSNSVSGIKKVSDILIKNNFKKLKKLTIESFESENNIFICTDKNAKELFKEILFKYNINFIWRKDKANKMPDLLIKTNNRLYILEHKHIKEGGGGQNNQIIEVKDFISNSENHSKMKISYIVFMDGIYFNSLSLDHKNKLGSQTSDIRNALITNKDNYFVNTFGFKEFLKNIK